MPRYPFEVVFQALEVTRPEGYSFDDIEVLTNRNSLRKLLDFAAGRGQDSFRIDLYMVGGRTLVIERRERSVKEMIRGSVAGFGHNFEEVSTIPPKGLEDAQSSQHHRVVSYKLGNVRCAVRFEVDAGYGLPPAVVSPTAHESASGKGKARAGGGAEGLVQALGNLSLDQTKPKVSPTSRPFQATDSNSALVIRRGDAAIPQEHTAEIKTRAKPGSIGKSMSQLWFGRVGYLITAFHQNGNFGRVDITPMAERLRGWEETEANQTALRKLAGLLARLRELVEATPGKSCVAVCERLTRPPVLQLFEMTPHKRPLPDEVIGKFWGVKAGAAGA